jgi:hypothetical protein
VNQDGVNTFEIEFRKKSSSQGQEEGLISLNMVKELQQVQEDTTMRFLQAHIENTKKRFDNLIQEFQDLKTSLEFSQAQVKVLVKLNDLTSNQSKEQAKEIGSQLADIGANLNNINNDLKQFETKVDDLENRSRRNNLCFDGIPEEQKESWLATENKVKQILTEKLQIKTDEFTIERAHRVGRARQSTNRPRTAIMKFQSFKTHELILGNSRPAKVAKSASKESLMATLC